MSNRRQFLQATAAATAGIFFSRCPLVEAAAAALQSDGKGKRREVSVGGRRVKTVDIHTHCEVPEVWELVKDYDLGVELRFQLDRPGAGKVISLANVADRLRQMDEQGIDVQAVGINPFWYAAERDLVRAICKLQNEKLAELVAAHPDRFVGMATLPLQFPYLAIELLEEGVKKLGMRGALIGGSVAGQELSAAKFHPFWAKAEELGVLIFIHPQTGVFPDREHRFQGNGNLGNVIGNPLETTIALEHLIFEGTLDRFPGVKICAAHGGGFFPSYSARSDACLTQAPANCKPVKKHPSEYLKQLYFDSLVFTPEALRHLVAEAGASQIVIGTDFPFGWTTRAVDHILETPGLSDADRRAMLGGTAARLLRIS